MQFLLWTVQSSYYNSIKFNFFALTITTKNVPYILIIKNLSYLSALKPEKKLISRREKYASSILSLKYSLKLRKSNVHQCEFLYIWYTFHHKKEVAIWGAFLKHESNFCGGNVLPWSFLSSYMDLNKLYHMCSYLKWQKIHSCSGVF